MTLASLPLWPFDLKITLYSLVGPAPSIPISVYGVPVVNERKICDRWTNIANITRFTGEIYSRTARGSCLVLVWRKSIHCSRRYARKTIFTYSFPVTMTFNLLTTNLLVYRSYYLHQMWSFYSSLISSKSKTRNKQTDRQTGLQRFMRPPRKGRIIIWRWYQWSSQSGRGQRGCGNLVYSQTFCHRYFIIVLTA